MRALRILVVVMGVLIVLGTATLAVMIVKRTSSGGPALASELRIEEPQGTQINAVTTTQDRIVLHLKGGGPDRVIWIDPKTNLITGRAVLAR